MAVNGSSAGKGSMTGWKKLSANIYKVGDMVFFRVQVRGRRKMEKAPLQGSLALTDRGRPTDALKKAARDWVYREMNREYLEGERAAVAVVPTFDELLDAYEVAAIGERARTGGRPAPLTVTRAVQYFEKLLDACGLDRSRKCNELTDGMIANAISRWIGSGKQAVSAWTYAASAKSVTARWMSATYSAKHWTVPDWIIPPKGPQNKPPRYKWPKPETFEQVRKWYAGLADAEDPRWWSMATLMLYCGMRNIDVELATTDWLVERDDGSVLLDYVPHKTALTSGRRVLVPLLPELRDELLRRREAYMERRYFDGDELVPHATWAFVGLNHDLRKHVDEWRDKEKACYELRKMCGATVYKKLGAEAACARLGDDLKTVSYFYADPAAAHGQAMSVSDLLA